MVLLCLLPFPAAAQVESAVDAAEAWLLTQQNANGSFGPLQALRPRDTAVTTLALAERPNAATALGGAMTYLSGAPLANTQDRSHHAQALAATGNPVASVLSTLQQFRNGGGMGAFAGHQSSLLDTAYAVQAFGLDEVGYQVQIVELLDYLQTHQAADGGWGFVVGGPSSTYDAGETLAALAQLEQLAVEPAVLNRAAAFLLARQQSGGSFGNVLETAVAYRGLLALGKSESELPFGSPVPYLLAQQAGDGSWSADVFTTAQVVRVLRDQKPNFTLSGVSLVPNSALPGTLVEARLTLHNRGPRGAGASHLAIRQGSLTGTVLAELAVEALASGAQVALQVAIPTTGLSGAVDLVVVADDQDEVAESSEGDNDQSVRLTLRGGPDLAIYPNDLTLSPTQPLPGQSFQLRANARNLGESTVASFAYRVVRLVAGVPGEVLATGTAGPVGPGAAVLLPINLTLAEGEHSVEVQLDDAAAIAEEDETNNQAPALFFVVDPSQADLSVVAADLTLTPAQPAVGGTADLTVIVRNLGQRPATSDVVIYDNSPAEGGAELYRSAVNLAAGGQIPVQASLPVGAATYAYTVVVDPAGAVLETVETNNSVQRFFRDLPDLALGFDNLELRPASPLAGDAVSVDITVRNKGTAAASNVLVELFDGDPAAGGTLVASTVLAEVPVAGNRRSTLTWPADGGRSRLFAVADRTNTVIELSETNNQTLREVAVPRATGPDLQITALDTSALTASPLDLSLVGNLVVTLANQGEAAAAGPFEVRVFADLDGDGSFGAVDSLLGTAVYGDSLAVGASAGLPLALATSVPFHHALIWVEADATDVVQEKLEGNNTHSLYAACLLPTPAASTEPRLEWALPGLNVETVPLVAQLNDDNGDGRIDSRDAADIVVQASDATGNGIFARSGLDGSALWTLRSTPANPLADHLAQAALADLDGDGLVEILGHQSNGRFIALEHDGRLKWVSDAVPGVGYRFLGAPAIGDLSGDGVPEIAHGRAVLDAQGRLISIGTGNRGENYNYYGPFGSVMVPGVNGYAHSIIADVDLDGRNELVAGDTLYRLNAGVLEVVWNKTVPDHLMDDGWNAVGNLDADPYAEIVYVSSGQIMVLNHDGTTAASRRMMVEIIPFNMPTFWGGSPTLADLDGDGKSEILVVTATQLIAYNANLGVRWRKAMGEDFGGFTGVSAFDLDGNGSREVLFNDPTTFYVINGTTGATLHTRPNLTFTAMEHATVADVDGDGRAEIVLGSNRDINGSAATQGLYVLGNPSWRGARGMWNQYSYQVSNIGLDGTVPFPQTPSWQLYQGFRSQLETAPPQLGQANLTLSLPRVGQPTPQGVPLTLRVGNGGREPVPAGIRLELYDGLPGVGAVVGSLTTTRGLRPGSYQDVVVFWQGAADGNVTAYAQIDSALAVAECDELDNLLAFPLEISLLPDLAIAAGGVTATSPSPAGGVVPVRVKVDNLGVAATGPSVVRLYAGDPATNGPVAEVALASVAAGASRVVDVPWDTVGRLPGVYNLYAVLDPDETLDEANETNNRGLVQLELVAPNLPDLTVSTFQINPSVALAGEPVSLSVLVVNRGTTLEGGFEVAFRVNGAEVGRASTPLTLEGQASRVLEFELPTANYAGLLALEARLDPSAQVAESNESNNVASGSLQVTASTLRLQMSTDKVSYGANSNVAINLTATNTSSQPANAHLLLQVVDSGGVVVATVADTNLTLAVGASSSAYSWNTGDTLAGPYSLVGTLRQGNAVAATASRLFSIAAQLNLSVSLFADRDEYAPLQPVVLTGAVQNLANNQILSDLSVKIAVRGPSPAATEVFATTLAVPQLLPSATRPVGAVWEIGNRPGGIYTASVAVRDAAGLLLKYAETQVQVENSAQTGSGLTGELELSPRALGAGAPFLAAYTVTNGGNAAMPELQLRLELRRLTDGGLEEALTRAEPLAQASAATGTFGVPTAGLPEEEYLVTLVGVLPGQERRLDSQTLTIERGVSIRDVNLLEGDGGPHDATFELVLSSPAPTPVSVAYATHDGSATAGQDYLAASGVVEFAPGETTKTVTVVVFGDTLAETAENFLVSLEPPVGASSGDLQALATLVDEEGCVGPNLLENAGAEAELTAWTAVGVTNDQGWSQRYAAPTPLAGTGYFAYTGSNTPIELYQEADVSAYAARIDAGQQAFAFSGFLRSAGNAPSDRARMVVEYRDANGAVLAQFDTGTALSSDTWRNVTDTRPAPPNTRRLRVRLLATDDNADGKVEAYFDHLELGSLGVAVLSFGELSFAEGDSGNTPVALSLDLSCPAPTALTVGYLTSTLVDDPEAAVGAALDGVDFQMASGDVTFTTGETVATLELAVLGDILDERDERFRLELTSGPNLVVLTPAVDVTISDDDGAVTLDVLDATLAEGAGPVTLTARLSAISGRPVQVNWATANGSAVAGSDYQTASGQLSFPPGTTEQTFQVNLVADGVHEAAEAFSVRLTAPVNVALVNPEVQIAVLDDDPVAIAIADAAQVDEGDSGSRTASFTVSLSVPSVVPVTVAYTTADAPTAGNPATAGTDYQPAAGTLTFPPGTTSQVLTVAVLGDVAREPTENFLVLLSQATEASLADPEAVGTIFDDDGILISIGNASANDQYANLSRVAGSVVRASSFYPGYPTSRAADGNLNTSWFTACNDRAPWFEVEVPTGSTVTQVLMYGNREFAEGYDFISGKFEIFDSAGVVVHDTGVVALPAPNRDYVLNVPPLADFKRVRFTAATLQNNTCDNGLAELQVIGIAPVNVNLLVTLSKAATFPVAVQYQTFDGTAQAPADYTAASGTLNFPPGITQLQVPVRVIADAIGEPVENFFVRLSQPVEAQILDDEGEVKILDTWTWATVDEGSITALTPGCIRLTPDAGSRRGAAWRTEKIDLTRNLDKTFRVYLGTRDGDGSDGIAFVLQNIGLSAIGNSGGYLGLYPLSPTLGLELDTYDNGNFDPTEDHFAVHYNGVWDVPRSATPALLASGANVEDGREHLLRVIWNAQSKQLSASFDGVPRLAHDVDIATQIFGGTQQVYYGLTAGSGYSNEHYFCEEQLCADGSAPRLSVGQAQKVEGDGTGTAMMSVPVTLSCPAAETLTVEYATADLSAAAGEDYQAVSGSLSFAPGVTSAWIQVPILADDIPERDEKFEVRLSQLAGGSAQNASLWYTTGVATIVTDDVAWYFNGDGSETAGTVPAGCYQLTQNQGSRSGSVWRSETIDLRKHFDMSFDVFVGTADNNADGVVFTLQNIGPTAIGGGGAGIGYSGMTPSVGVEVDTWQNSWDIAADHVSILTNGDVGAQTGMIAATPAASNIEDGQTHRLRVIWNADARNLDVHFDGSERIFSVRDYHSTVFGAANPNVYWGFVSGTGSASANHYFCPTRNCFGPHARPSISVGDGHQLEGNSGSTQMLFPLTLHCPSQQVVSVRVRTLSGTATAGSDFVAIDQVVTFQPGETSKTVAVTILGDTTAEPSETFVVELSQAQNGELYHPQGLGEIQSDDILITVEPGELLEGSGGNIAQKIDVVLSDVPPAAVTLQYRTLNGTAIAGQDFVGINTTNLTIPAGQRRATFTLTVIGDGLEEGNETFVLDVTAPVGSRVVSRQVPMVIEDEDQCPGGNMLANGSAELAPLTASWTQVSGAWDRLNTTTPVALDGTYKFFAGAGPLAELRQAIDLSSFATRIDLGLQSFYFEGFVQSYNQSPPDSARVILEYRAANDAILAAWDSGEMFNTDAWRRLADLRVAPIGARKVLVRLISQRYSGDNNDGYFDKLSFRPLGWPTLSVVDTSIYEGESGERNLNFVVQQSCVSTLPTQVDYLTLDGTATANADYRPTSGTLIVPAGATSANILVPVYGDTFSELDETLSLVLANSQNAGIGRAIGVGTILQDEVLLAPGSVSVIEGNSGTVAAVFNLTLSAPSSLTIQVDYATGGGSATSGAEATAGTDYVATSGTAVFAPGETVKPIAVQVLGDLEVEADETFRLNLSNPVNVTLADTRGYADIRDDDVEVNIEDVNVTEGNTGNVAAVFVVTLSKASSNTITVDWATADGLAVAGQDYQAASGRLTFAPGALRAEARVNVLGDTLLENAENFSVFLSAPVNVRLMDEEGVGLIIDDDNCPGPNLLVNEGGELLTGNELTGWTEVTGTDWTRRQGDSSRQAFLGTYHFFARNALTAELRQVVDVTPFATFIDAGLQRFAFQGFVSTHPTDNDPARIVVNYLSASDAVLDAFDSGEIVDATGWQQVSDQRLAPVGTRKIAVRLLTRKTDSAEPSADGYFDNLSLRSIGTPVMSILDREILEGDTDNVIAPFEVVLTCASENPMSVAYTTADGTATVANNDYVPNVGTLSFAVGESRLPLPVVIPGDFKNELIEKFTLHFSNEVGMVLLDRVAEGAIRDADPGSAPVPGVYAVYTLDEQFDTGELVSVHHDIADQLQLTENGSTFPFIWIALSNRGTVVKLDIETGKVLGEYSTSPDNLGVDPAGSDPSRTTVALDGSVWVANRQGQSVVHIGLPEFNQCVDRNNNGFIETSVGQNDILKWPNANGENTNGGVSTAKDECVLHYVKVSTSGTRHISVTKDNDIWVSGTGSQNKFDLIDGDTGQILRTESTSCGGYGGLVDGNGVIWSITYLGSVLRWDPSVVPATAASKRCLGGLSPYGIGIDGNGWVWITQPTGNAIRKVSPDGNTIIGPFGHGDPGAQGLAVDANDDVWVSTNLNYDTPRIGHIKNDGTFVGNVTGVCISSTGIAVDAKGKIWAACYDDHRASRIDPNAGPIGADGVTKIGAVDLTVQFPLDSWPYNYSDMTGFVALRSTAPQGTFTVIQDSGIPQAEWGNVSWNTEAQAAVPPGSSIIVQVRASDNVAGLGGKPWVNVSNGVSFEVFGRFLQVRAVLRPAPDGTSPVLSDLRIGVVDDAEVSLGDVTVVEGDAGEGRKAVFPIQLARSTVLTTRFDYTAQAGSALVGSDFEATSGTVIIPAGQTTATIEIPIVGDDLQEGTENFRVVLSNPLNAILVDGDATATVTDDDVPALVLTKTDTAVAGSLPIRPGDEVRYTVQVASTGTGVASGVVLQDPLPAHTTLVAGSVSTSVGLVTSETPLTVTLGDLPPATTATVAFTVKLATNVPNEVSEIANQATASSLELAPVASDDPDTAAVGDPTRTPVVVNVPLTVADVTVTERSGELVDAIFQLVLGQPSTRTVSFRVTTEDVTALVGEDYEPFDAVVEIPAGATGGTLVIPVAGDFLPEATETFRLLFSEPVGVELPLVPAIGTILDNDSASCLVETFDGPPAAAWQHAFVGNATTGSFGSIGGRLRLSGNGTELYHGDDNGHFAYQTVTGDFRVEVDVAAIAQNTGGQPRKACLMVRTSLDKRAPRVMACYQPQFSSTVTALQFDARLTQGAAGIELASTVQNVALPTRLAFTRRGDRLTVSYSRDGGVTWAEPKGGLGGTVSLPPAASLLAGVMVASYQTPTLFGADFDQFRICHPAPSGGGRPGDRPVCEPQRPLDVYYLVDLSESMGSSLAGDSAVKKLDASRAALDRIHQQLALRRDGSRASLLTFAGKRNLPFDQQTFLTVRAPLTSDFRTVGTALANLDRTDIQPLATTPTAIAFEQLADLVDSEVDPTHLPVILLFTDGVPNIDRVGRGPDAYRLDEISGLRLRDNAGEFLSWAQVAWLGTFNGTLDTFDGEPLGNAMAALDDLARRQDDALIYGFALNGNGIELGTFNQDLVDYAAWVTGGKSYPIVDLTGIDDATEAVLTEVGCDAPGTAWLGDTVWNDLDGDGALDPGEPGLAGVLLELEDLDGGVVASATTATDGTWEMLNVLPGSYRLKVRAISLPGGIDQATYDLDGLATPGEVAVQPSAFRVVANLDFGYRAQVAGPGSLPATTACEVDDFADPSLDPAWLLTTIGAASVGDAAIVDGQLRLTSNGSTLWDNDQIHFLQQSLAGDFRVEIELTGFPVDPGGSTLRKAGLMVRKSDAAKSPRLMVQVLPDPQNGSGPMLQFGHRVTENGPALSFGDVVRTVPFPVKLAIERRGDVYNAFYSTDRGLTWKTPAVAGVPSLGVQLDLGAEPKVGVAAASYQINPLTVAFDNFAVCRPSQVVATPIPAAGTCNPEQPIDLVFLLDRSGSMGATYEGAGSRWQATQLAFQALVDSLETRGDGSRVALVTYGGATTTAANLANSAQVLSGLTHQLEVVAGLVAGLEASTLAPTTPTSSVIALDLAGRLLEQGGHPGHRPVIVWLTDEPPTIDRLGRGPYNPEREPLVLSLKGADGQFLPWGRVAWLGPFRGAYGTFAAEPLANSMQVVERLKLEQPELKIHGLLLQGDGVTHPLVQPDWLDYAATFTHASRYQAANTTDLFQAVAQLGGDLACEP